MPPYHNNLPNSNNNKFVIQSVDNQRALCIPTRQPTNYDFGLPQIMKFRGINDSGRKPLIVPKQYYDVCPEAGQVDGASIAVHIQGPAIQHPNGVQPVVRPNCEKCYCPPSLAQESYSPVAKFRRTKILRPKEHDIFNVESSCEYRTRYQQEFQAKRGDRFPCPSPIPLGMDCSLQRPRFSTTYRDNFPSKYQPMETPILPPKSEMKIGVDELLRMESCQRQDYQKPPSNVYKYRKVNYIPEDKFKLSKKPLEDTSTMRGHFRGVWVPPPEPIVLTDRAEMQLRFSDCPMTFETDTRLNYRPFRIVPSSEDLRAVDLQPERNENERSCNGVDEQRMENEAQDMYNRSRCGQTYRALHYEPQVYNELVPYDPAVINHVENYPQQPTNQNELMENENCF